MGYPAWFVWVFRQCNEADLLELNTTGSGPTFAAATPEERERMVSKMNEVFFEIVKRLAPSEGRLGDAANPGGVAAYPAFQEWFSNGEWARIPARRPKVDRSQEAGVQTDP